MTADQLADMVRREAGHLQFQIGDLQRTLSESEQVCESVRKRANSNYENWKELIEEMGCNCHSDALDWIRRHRAAEAAEQPDTPDDGELVPWDATTRPRGVVMFRHCDETSDKESIVFLWMHNGFETYGGFRFNWKRALEQLEWSRDGITWQPCGVRKAVRS